MKTVYFLFGALAFAPCYAAVADVAAPVSAETAQRERDATAAALVRLISARLDNDFWRVDYQPQFDLIEVQSRKPDWVMPGVLINSPPLDRIKPELINFGFSLRVKPLVSPADYARFQSGNAAIHMQLAQMQKQMKDIGHKCDSYLPKDAAEKKRVDAYNNAKDNIHSLPLFYFRDLSLSLVYYDGQPVFESARLFDPNVQPYEPPPWQLKQKAAALAVAEIVRRYETPIK